MHDLKVWPGVEADGQETTTTPGKSTSGEDQMSRLAKVHIVIKNNHIQTTSIAENKYEFFFSFFNFIALQNPE